jgi:hypothetical protein
MGVLVIPREERRDRWLWESKIQEKAALEEISSTAHHAIEVEGRQRRLASPLRGVRFPVSLENELRCEV